MDKDILKRKIHLQKVRNCLANLKGVEVVRFCENNEHEKIFLNGNIVMVLYWWMSRWKI